MRMLLVFCLSGLLAACSGDPRSYGITGPGTQPIAGPPPVGTPLDAPESAPAPGVTTSGPFYGPTNGPSNGGSAFWGYN